MLLVLSPPTDARLTGRPPHGAHDPDPHGGAAPVAGALPRRIHGEKLWLHHERIGDEEADGKNNDYMASDPDRSAALPAPSSPPGWPLPETGPARQFRLRSSGQGTADFALDCRPMEADGQVSPGKACGSGWVTSTA